MQEKGSLVAKRTLQALLLFSDHKYLTLTEAAQMLGISQPAASRILNTLQELGFIKRDEQKKFSLDTLLIRLSKMVESNLRNLALPVMKELASEIGESVQISVSQHSRYYVIIEEIESRHLLKWSSPIGEPRELYAGSPGKTHLAFKNDDELNTLLDEMPLVAITPNTITDKTRLLEDLRRIRENGYAISKGEYEEGTVGISVPVMDSSKTRLVTVLSTVIPQSRFSEDKLPFYISMLKKSAEKISTLIW